jgi:amino acid transporter
MGNIKKLLIGRPLKNEAINEQKFSIFGGLPILASDALSSVAYASEEILLVLIPAIGILAYSKLMYISAAIIGLVILLAFSYRQTIESYPNGGGAYIVAKDNIGVLAGVTAGAALLVDYILTVAVSVSSGIAQIISAFPYLANLTVPICLLVIIILTIGNLRGIREVAKLFSIPPYAFIFAVIAMIVMGFIKLKTGYHPQQVTIKTTEPLTLFLLLTAFSNGCAALTGVEAVSNAVPNFKEPATKNARAVMFVLAGLIIVLFGGVSILANMYHVVPDPEHGKTVFMLIAGQVFGNGFMYYFTMVATFGILALAANTAYSDFPLLISIMAREGYAPRQLSMKGDRLSYSNGILILSSIAALLVVIFDANVTYLIGLYAIGVFISFTLSQSGMFLKWIRGRGQHWHVKAFINGLGAVVTFIVVVIIAVTKFREGAWIVVIIIPILIVLSLTIKRHYTSIACQLRIDDEELPNIEITSGSYRNHVIVPISSINRASIRALRYARTISEKVVAFNVSIDKEDGEKLKRRWEMLNTDVQLVIKYSPFRKIIQPLIKFVESEEHEYKRGDMITIVLPKFSLNAWWQAFLHNHTRFVIENRLLKYKHVVVATMPLQLKNDEAGIEKYMKKKCE